MVKPGYPACDAKLQGCHGQVHGRRKPPLSLRPVVVVKDDSEGIQAEKACAFRRQNAHAERERERERERKRGSAQKATISVCGMEAGFYARGSIMNWSDFFQNYA